MSKALYRTYRSIDFNDVVGQESIIKILSNSLAQNRLSHAYIFSGPRGVGKTSVARIFAHKINHLDYKNEDNNIDIIEIDGASNRGIDEIRQLRDSAQIVPSLNQYKIYIIDEVHMLTTPAFNALLKLFEEPPEHVIFILATTNYDKIPDTIKSRAQKFFFQAIPEQQIINRLQDISKSEKIKIDQAALNVIAKLAEGSLRDAISLLDQVVSSGLPEYNLKNIQEVLGLPLDNQIDQLVEDVFNNQDSLLQDLNAIIDEGKNVENISQLLHKKLIDIIIKKQLNHDQLLSTTKFLKNLLIVNSYSDPHKYLELCLLEYQEQLSTNQETSKEKITMASKVNSQKPTIKQVMTDHEEPQTVTSKPKTITNLTNNQQVWQQLLENIRQSHNTIYGILRMAECRFISDQEIELIFKFKFHQKRIMESKNNTIIKQQLKLITDQDFIINCSLGDPKPITEELQKTKPVINSDEIVMIENIFPGAQIL